MATKNFKPCAVIFIGLQASGKSTFFREKFTPDYVHINLDTLKTRYQEQLRLDDCLANRKSFVVDNTNPTRQDRQRYIPAAKEAGYHVVGYYFRSSLQECLERNAARGCVVKPLALAGTSKRLELPSYDEGFDELFYVSIDAVRETGSDGTALKKFIVQEWDETK